jgi:DNA-binding NtrC family response regulator
VGVEQLSQKVRALGDVVAARDGDSPATAPMIRETGPIEPLRPARAAFETHYIAAALRRHGGNVSQTARSLGISRVMLQKKMKAFGLR